MDLGFLSICSVLSVSAVTTSEIFDICNMDKLLTEATFPTACVNRVEGLFKSEETASGHPDGK